MKILLVSPLQKQANGGIAVWTDMFLECCKTADIEPTVLNIAMTGRRLENGSARRNYLDEFARTRKIFKDLKKAVKKEKYDAVHINTSCARFGIIRDYFIAKRIKKKQPQTRIILHCNCDVEAQIKTKRAEKYLKKLVAISTAVLVLCDSSVAYLMEKFGVKSIKIPNFIDGDAIAKTQRKHSEDIKRLLFVGRVERKKGVFEIFQIAQRYPEYEFEFVGAVSDEVLNTVKPKNVILTGQIAHGKVFEKMDEADVFIFPSHTEGFSIALLESMARGLPAIATDVGANADMLSGECGEVVPPQDTEALALAIQRMKDVSHRQKMSENAMRKVKEEYNTDTVMNRIKDCYLSVG